MFVCCDTGAVIGCGQSGECGAGTRAGAAPTCVLRGAGVGSTWRGRGARSDFSLSRGGASEIFVREYLLCTCTFLGPDAVDISRMPCRTYTCVSRDSSRNACCRRNVKKQVKMWSAVSYQMRGRRWAKQRMASVVCWGGGGGGGATRCDGRRRCADVVMRPCSRKRGKAVGARQSSALLFPRLTKRDISFLGLFVFARSLLEFAFNQCHRQAPNDAGPFHLFPSAASMVLLLFFLLPGRVEYSRWYFASRC